MAKVIDGKSYSWTQPVCTQCYESLYPGQQPHRLIDRTAEICCQCGNKTGAGIWIRMDPATCPFPTPTPTPESTEEQ